MDRKIPFNFNPQMYDDELSPFGKKVLRTLIRQWQNRSESTQPVESVHFRQNTNQTNFIHGNSAPNFRSKKTFKFRESEEIISSKELLGLPVQNNETTNSNINSIQIIDDSKQNNPETWPLPLPTGINDDFADVNVPDNESYCASIIKPIEFNTNITSENLDITNFEPKLGISFLNSNSQSSIIDANNNVNTESVVWNNMLDAQLFDNEQLNIENDGMFKTPVIVNKNLQQMRLPNDEGLAGATKAIVKAIAKNKKKQRKVDTTDYESSASKRKSTKVTEIIPKKTKKSSVMAVPKIQRKQKYTTAVKNWLDDVDPKNSVEGDITDDIIINKESHKLNKANKIEVDLNKPMCNKKVVQAQLTNKDGIMKYDKPKDQNENNENKTVTETKVIKEKKTKPKFVVPIKSQVPVKDIVYEIYNIDCSSVINHSLDLKIKDSDIFMVLTYGNGFNQLNSQFTEDVCLPEAMMFLINDNFYYLIGKDFNVTDDIAALVKNNTVVCYGGKSVLKYLAFNFNIDVYEVKALDTKIGGSLIDPDNPLENFSDLQRLLNLSIQYTIATDCPLQKAAWYLTLMKESRPRLSALLKENSLWEVFVDIEMAVMPIIANMEMRGITIDSDKLKSMETTLLNKMKKTEQECYKAAGKKFQINSTVQVRTILYDELQLDSKSNVRIKETVAQGAKSTSETMLRSLTAIHPLPKLILDYRQLHKAHATFLVGIFQHVKDGVLRPTWEQTAAATGRIAANNPNIQAIPKAEINFYDLSEGDEDTGPQHLNFRSIYTSRPDFVLLAADFNHVECRVFAHAAADEGLLELLATGRDLFRVLAAKWLTKPEESITREDRERTKRIVYASLYGAGARKLTDILGVSYDQALTVFSSFNRTFPSLKTFGRSVVGRCSRDGGSLSTLCGRVRRFAHIDSSDAALKAQAERQAVNFIVQGSAADLCKLAMVRSVQQLRASGVEAYLLMQIHDELVWEIRRDQLDLAAGIIKSSMEGCGMKAGVGGTLPVSLNTGECWGLMTSYTP